MDDQLPETRSDQPPASRPEGTRELVVSGTEVYLPDSKRIRPGDPDFKVIVAEVLHEYAPSLSDEVLGRPRRYPWWAVILILVFFGSLFAGLYLLRPVRMVENTSLKVPPPKITSYSGEFSREFREAEKYKGEKKYEDARKCLEPAVDRLLARWEADPEKVKKEAKDKNAVLFYSYFGLFNNLPWNDEAGERVDKLITFDSDYRWKLFEIQYQLWRMGGEKPGWLSSRATVASLYKIMGRIDRLRKLLNEDGDKRKEIADSIRQLDLYKCYFGLKVWRLQNRGKPNDELGLGDREEVLEIALRYPKDIKFLLVRQYLVRQLIKDGPTGWYIFNRKEYFLIKHLDGELEKIDHEIAKLKKETK